ncbi:MAG: DUF1294 domain-containing protein [Lachnospiraceae bacterium]|nr:DUF1294 domain-containing protein [Lachnospiraceae bacterium]
MLYCIIAWYVIISVISFAMYGIDKKKAVKGQWRIPEATLLLTGLIGGAVGSLIGMKFFHHKTKKPLFFILVPVFVLLHVLIIAFLVNVIV